MLAIVLTLLLATAVQAAVEQPNCFVSARPLPEGVQVIVSALPGYRMATGRAHALQSGLDEPVRPTTVTGFEVAWVLPPAQARSFTVTVHLTNRLRTRQWPVHIASTWDGDREICAISVVDAGPALPEEPGLVAQADAGPPAPRMNPIAPPPHAALPETTLAASVVGGAPVVRSIRTKIQRSEATSKLLEEIRKRR